MEKRLRQICDLLPPLPIVEGDKANEHGADFGRFMALVRTSLGYRADRASQKAIDYKVAKVCNILYPSHAQRLLECWQVFTANAFDFCGSVRPPYCRNPFRVRGGRSETWTSSPAVCSNILLSWPFD